MSVALLEPAQRQRPLDANASRGAPRPSVGGRRIGAVVDAGRHFQSGLRVPDAPTLDRLVTLVWRELACSESVQCPACRGRMVAGEGPSRARQGHCVDCGAQLT